MDIDVAADALRAAMRRGVHMPPEWRGRLTMREAYAVNLAIARRLEAEGDARVGWKVGLTSAAMQAQWGVPEPCFGVLMRSGGLRSGTRLRHDGLRAPGIENELCLTVGAPLRGPGATVEDAARAVAEVSPAIEVVEVRGDFAGDLPLSMADNAQHKAFVTGAGVPFDPSVALERVRVEVRIAGTVRDRAAGVEVMGGPLHSLAWLANKLAEFGLALAPGERVMSGSFTRQYAVARGDEVVAAFEPFGEVRVAFD